MQGRARLSRAWRGTAAILGKLHAAKYATRSLLGMFFSSRCVSDLLVGFDQRREARKCMVDAGGVCVSFMQEMVEKAFSNKW